MKVGRNDPCPCGSGAKYKRCCLPGAGGTGGFPPSILSWALREQAERAELQAMGIRINYVRPALLEGQKYWALGSRLYRTRGDLSFHDFLIETLAHVLGDEWWSNQRSRSPDDRHFLAKCFDNFHRMREFGCLEPGIATYSAESPGGLVHHLRSVAFDVATLMHRSHLSDHLLRRLRHRDQYQGARYEIGIAAVFSRLDCDVEFYDTAARGRHPEFVASIRDSEIQIAVEAKSKHREGVINVRGVFDESDVKTDIRRQLREARKQNPGNLPFMIFVDINLPPRPDLRLPDKSWMLDLTRKLQRQSAASRTPDPVTLTAVTNFAQHYDRNRPASPGEFLMIHPEKVKYPVPRDFLADIQRALISYGNVPNFDTREEASVA